RTARKGGWTIIFTHDVRRNPSPFGTRPEALKRLVKLSQDTGLDVLSMSAAYALIQTEALQS
ncbi:MAG: chitin deacetylase, partial [Pseudomonadota bacterium]